MTKVFCTKKYPYKRAPSREAHFPSDPPDPPYPAYFAGAARATGTPPAIAAMISGEDQRPLE